jgi:acetyl/propionyl-CoA carboxylase alpha subunit
MFKKILIANRGEIAVRIIRTCREMGIQTVAVFSDVDTAAAHVLEADEAVLLGESEPSRSYLNIDRIMDAARSSGAEAIHPGYGFLAENPDFAERCETAGINFVGPPSSVIRDLGNKTLARTMEMEAACLSAASEAEKAFGDGSLYLEKCLKAPRHVEFQILADQHGNVVHLFERECSIQRRHQKIIEETPSPAMTALASGYVNAGTVEFLLDQSGQFYFLEVNTRLQVEHPITEMTTGIDLVREQLEIAAGSALTFKQKDIIQRGHAIECRIYAEDPEVNFFPSPGLIVVHREPSGPGIRNDCGVYEGFEVPVEYDPILSKLVVTAGTREAVRRRMIRALKSYVILGIRTTIPFLIDVLKSPEFVKGNTFTNFIDLNFENWTQCTGYEDMASIAYVVHELTSIGKPSAAVKERGWPTPWETLGDWRI